MFTTYQRVQENATIHSSWGYLTFTTRALSHLPFLGCDAPPKYGLQPDEILGNVMLTRSYQWIYIYYMYLE